MKNNNKISVSPDDGERNLEAVRKKAKKSKFKARAFCTVFALALCIVGGFLCYSKLFIIKNCVVNGDVPYTPDEVLNGAGMSYGMNLYEMSAEEMQENVLYSLPYIDSFTVSHRWPSTIVFNAEPAVPSMYLTVNDKMFVLSQSLRVLSETDDIAYIESNRLLHVVIGGVTKCVAGEYLETEGGTSDVVKEIFGYLYENDLSGKTDELDIYDKFNITFSYDSKYLVKVGDTKNLDLKIKFMRAIIDKKSAESNSAGGIIDVSNENAKEGIFKTF